MLSSNIRRILGDYLDRFPTESENLSPLVELLDGGVSVVTRKDFAGHVTCGAIVLNPLGKLLMVHHKTLDKWLFPGGHLENEDASLRDAALRELVEETGVSKESLKPFNNWLDETPIHIDRHLIPQNNSKGEPDHYHYDFRFLFSGGTEALEIQEAEVLGAEWAEPVHAPLAITERLKEFGLLTK